MPSTKPNASRKSSAPAKAVSPPLQGSVTALQDAAANALPPAWTWTRLKFVAGIGNGSTPDRSNAKYWCSEGFPWLNSSVVNVTEVSEGSDFVSELALKECHLPVLNPLAVLVGLTGQGKTRGSATLLTIPATINQHLAFVAPTKEKSDARYLRWLLVSKYHLLREQSSDGGSTKGALTCEDLKELTLPLPPLPTQRAIAGYLDRETKRLDELVRAKEGLLELVAEKRRALITRAVTRGLNPKSPLRDSGIPWLGLIPAHWEIERSKWLLTERDERSTTGEEEMLTVSHITGVTPRSEKDVNMFEAETNEGYKLCQAGDLVINTLWAWMGAMGTARVPGMVSPAYNVYTPGPRLTSDYVDALVRIPVFAQEVIRFSKGVWSSRLRLYPEGLYEIWFPVPPLDEQRAIVAHIATETAKLDALRASAERTIALLKERRSALISAAVTGKIAISEATA